MIISNRKLGTQYPGLIDFAQTVLDLFGVPRPGYLRGISMLDETAGARRTSLADAYFPGGKPAILDQAADPQEEA